jgi:glyoxylase-like metal-dependent hydrolase (beta-lactamase superfamily II)
VDWVKDEVAKGALVQHAVVGFAAANCFIMADEASRDAAVIDPGTGDAAEIREIIDEIERLNLNVKYVLNTHGHPDHMWGNDVLKDALGGEVMIHELDGLKLTDPERNSSVLFGYSVHVRPADTLLKEGDEIEIGALTLKVIHTPGHSAGGVAFVGDGFVFTGDTLFAGSIGRSDLPCSSEDETVAFDVLLDSIRDRLFALPDDTAVLPGHGPSTTIGIERATNPFLR